MSFRRFVGEVYAPSLHLLFAGSWVLSLLGTLVAAEGGGQPWHFDLRVAVCILVVFLTLFFLRVVDEWKDFDYDKVYKPDKPLVQGVVTHGQLFTYLRVTALLTLGLSAWLSWTIAVIVALDMAWGLFLVSLERMSRVVRENVFVNLLVTYPVNVALSVCVYVFFLEQYGVAPSLSGVLLIGGFAVAFLSYEFLRKAVWPHLAEPGERVYATVVGGYGAIGLCVGAAATGCALVISVLLSQSGSGWGALLVAGSLAAPVAAAARFLQERGRRVKLAPFGTVFLLLFYSSIFVEALVGTSLAWGTL